MDLDEGALRIVTDCAGLRPGERVAVILDPGGDTAVAEAIAAAARTVGATAQIVPVATAALSPELTADTGLRPAEDSGGACPEIALADVLFGVTSRSLYHSAIGRRAAQDGARVLALTGCSTASLTGGAINADFAALEDRCRAITRRLSEAAHLTVSSPAGLSMSAELTGRSGYANTGRALMPGDRTGCLDVEAFIAPVESSVQGTLVADGSTTLFGLVDSPVTIEIRDGLVVSCDGGRDADCIRGLIERHGPSMAVIAEFGFGMNPSAGVVGDIIQDEATYGTGHVALGSNESFGGANRAPLHFDLVYWRPTVRLDGELVIADGQLADPADVS